MLYLVICTYVWISVKSAILQLFSWQGQVCRRAWLICYLCLFGYGGTQQVLTISVTLRVSYKRQEVLLFRSTWAYPPVLAVSVLLICLVFCVVFFVLFVFVLCLVNLMLPVSVYCPFMISPSGFPLAFIYRQYIHVM